MHTYVCVSGVRNVSFLENFANILNEWPLVVISMQPQCSTSELFAVQLFSGIQKMQLWCIISSIPCSFMSDASERTLQKRFLMTCSSTLSRSHQNIHSKINEDLPKEWITSYSIHDYQFENIVTFRKLPWMIQWRKIIQKQPPRGILRKRCSGNMQQVYRRTPMFKCDFSQVTLQLLKIFFGMVVLL